MPLDDLGAGLAAGEARLQVAVVPAVAHLVDPAYVEGLAEQVADEDLAQGLARRDPTPSTAAAISPVCTARETSLV